MRLKVLFRKVLLKILTLLDSPPSSVTQTNASMAVALRGGYNLDETTNFVISGGSHSQVLPRWMPIIHCTDKRLSLILVAGEQLNFSSSVEIGTDSHLYVRYSAASPNINIDGLVCEILFTHSNQCYALASLPISGGDQPFEWRVADFDITWLAGRNGFFSIRCLAGVERDPRRDRLAIADFCIAREDQLPLFRARSFHAMRSKNEIEHFSNVYRHSMYSTAQDKQAAVNSGQRLVRKLVPGIEPSKTLKASSAFAIEPLIKESPYDYASRLLASCVSQTPPDFLARLKTRAATGNVVKVLSLCSGAARIEASYAAELTSNVEWALLDINVDLLGLASKQFAQSVKLDLIEANVNDMVYSGEKWDVILCVSALHHVVELDSLLKFCHDSLNEGGEFWSIGEYVGRNGNRLWPDAKEEANKFFSSLPDRYRLNHHTNEIDQYIPDNDYSVGCFEGIRSEEIESILNRWFQPIDVCLQNCFLWRIINLAYSDNYDLSKKEDQQLIINMVTAEVDHFMSGGHGTELYGVYRPKTAQKIAEFK